MNLLPLDEIVLTEEPRGYLFNKKVYESVTGYINAAGLGPDFSAVPKDRLERAQDRGIKVHQCCHYLNEGDLDMDSVDVAIVGYIKAYEKFLDECKITPIAIEKKMVEPEFLKDEDGNNIGLAGTPDLICWLRGRRSIVDYKTCVTLTKSVGLQLAGYQLLWEKKYPSFPIYDRYALKLGINGNYKLTQCDALNDFRAFVDLVRYCHAKKKRDAWAEIYH